MAPAQTEHFIRPSLLASVVNRGYGWLTGFGLSPSYSYLLLTTGRRTKKTHATPVNLLVYQSRYFLVGTRGHTHWSRNLTITGTGILRRASTVIEFTAQQVPEETKPEVLKAYLTRFHRMAWRFFPLPYSAPLAQFAEIAVRHPVFELTLTKNTYR